MSDGISDMMIQRDAIFEKFAFEENNVDGSMYLEVREDTFICYDYAYNYWYIEQNNNEVKIYPTCCNHIEKLIDLL